MCNGQGKGFVKHNGSETHIQAMNLWREREIRREQGSGVDRQLCEGQIEKNKYYLCSIFDVIKFLAMNEMAFRGNNETMGELQKPDDFLLGGKFQQLLLFTAEKDQKLKAAMMTIPENAKYTSPEIQNEIIEIMAESVQEQIVQEIAQSDGDCFSIQGDGTRDKNNIEHLSVCVRYVKDGEAFERLLDIAKLDDLDSESTANAIIDVIEKAGLKHEKIISQSYDGASVMSGRLGKYYIYYQK